MNKLNNIEMYSVDGGAVKWGVVALIGGILTFVVGIVDGYTNPQKCHN